LLPDSGNCAKELKGSGGKNDFRKEIAGGIVAEKAVGVLICLVKNDQVQAFPWPVEQ
jgi:hypothetical protein